MTSAFDLLVLAAFFAPMALLVAINLATFRPTRAPHGLLGRYAPAPIECPPQDAAEEAEPLRRAA